LKGSKVNNTERLKAILNYEKYDRMPACYFSFWTEACEKWAQQGHITAEQARGSAWLGSVAEKEVARKLGFDFGYHNVFPILPAWGLLNPAFEPKVLKENPDGSREFFNPDGVVVVQKDDAGSIPAEIDHTLKDRASWEEHYKARVPFSDEAIKKATVYTPTEELVFEAGGLDFLKQPDRENPIGLMIGSLLGKIRDWLGVVGLSYMIMDDEELLDEIIQAVSDSCYARTEYLLKAGA